MFNGYQWIHPDGVDEDFKAMLLHAYIGTRSTYLMTVSVLAQSPLTMICWLLAPCKSKSWAPYTRMECPLMSATIHKPS